MLIIKRFIDQIEKQHVIFVNIHESDEDNIVFVIKMHSELIKDDDDIQFDKIFAVNNLS